MFIYNVHAPLKTFALAAKDKEDCASLIERILAKARLPAEEAAAVRAKSDGAGIVYEYEGDRWALEDDDDLAIVNERFRSEIESNPSPSITLHIVPPTVHVFTPLSGPPPPTYVSASAQIRQRTEKNGLSRSGQASPVTGYSIMEPPRTPRSAAGGDHHQHDNNRPPRHTDPLTAATSLGIPNAEKNRARSVRSARSTRSRRSKWGDDDAEPLGDVKRRQFNEFQANNGVRTVLGKVGNVDNVRMLLKQGHRHIYISRTFAVRHGLISSKQTPGVGGYSGLQILGNVPITVGSRTGIHTAMLSEEPHFDVILGRSWIEKMNIKVDPLDQTMLTYMDSGEVIPCDLVVLRDAKGEIITIT